MKTIFDFMPNISQKSLINFWNRSSYSILQVVQDYRHWWNVHLIFHKVPQEKVEGGQIWRSRRSGSGPSVGGSMGRPEPFPLQMQPVSTNFLNHFLIEFAVGGSFSNFLLNSRWTVITDFVEWNSSTQNAFSGWVAILGLCCTLVARFEITSYTCTKKILFELLFIMVCV